jgi:hypothetical protein
MTLPQLYALWEYWASLTPRSREARGIEFKGIFKTLPDSQVETVISAADFVDGMPNYITPEMLVNAA